MRIFIYREVSISPVEDRQRLPTLFLLPQDSHTVEPASKVKSALQSRSIPKRLRSRGSHTLDSFSQNISSISLVFFLTSFCLSNFSFTLTHLLRYFYYHSPSRTPRVIILIVEVIPVYRQKQSKSILVALLACKTEQTKSYGCNTAYFLSLDWLKYCKI